MARKKSVDDTVKAEKEITEVAPYKTQKEDAEAATEKSSSAGVLLAVAGITIAVAAAVILFNKSEQSVLASFNADDKQQIVVSEDATEVTADVVEAVSSEITETDTATTQVAPMQVAAPAPWNYAYTPAPYGYVMLPSQKVFEDMVRRDQEAMARQQEAIKREWQKRLQLAQNRFKFDDALLRDNRKHRPDASVRQAEWRAKVEKRREEADRRFNEMIQRNKEAREVFERAVYRGI